MIFLLEVVSSIYNKNRTLSWFAKSIKYLHRTFTFNLYIRFIIESLVLYSLAWFYEIRDFYNSQINQVISGIISILFAWLLILFILFGFIQWLKTRNRELNNEEYYFQNFLSGIKHTNWKRLYTTIFLMRRLILISIVTFGQIFHLIMVWYLRPG